MIADDYIPEANAPDGQGGNKITVEDTYKLNFSNVYKDYTGASWISQNSKGAKWLSQFLGNNSYNTSSSTNVNIRVVAYMMDTNIWSIYAGTNAEYAMGGPTLEMFCASYKDTHPNIYIECSVTNTNGYSVRWSDGSYTDSIRGVPQDEFGGIYIKSRTTKASGMWLASPTALAGMQLIAYYDGFVGIDDYGYYNLGLRPIVCLKSEVKLEAVNETTYRIAN